MEWTEDREAAAQTLKDILSSDQVTLAPPCFNDEVGRPFILETDGGSLTVGGVLIQKSEEGKERPIIFESRTLNSAERWYSQFKKEVLAILHYLKTFQAYLFGRRFILRIDPTNVAGALKNYNPIDPTVGRRIGFIWQFDYKVERIAGLRNRADGLSRVCIMPEGIEDAEPIDAFLEYEGGTLVMDNEMVDAAPTMGQLLIQTLEKKVPAVVAELREGPVTTFRHKEEKDSWGATVGPKEELMAMAAEGGRDAVTTLVETWAQREWRYVVNQTQEEQDADRKEREFFLIQMYEGVFKEIGLLLIGNKQPTEVSPKAREEAEKYILDARDNLSGFVEAVALKKKTGKGVADWIEDFYLRHPFVRRFIVDNETEFINQEVLSRRKTLCLPIKIIEPYHPEANAPVERGHRNLKNTIVMLTVDDLGNWSRYLEQAVFSENMTPKRTTGCILAELWYRREIDFPIEALVPTWNRLDDDPHLTTEELVVACCQKVTRNEEALEEVVNRVMDSRMRDEARERTAKKLDPHLVESEDKGRVVGPLCHQEGKVPGCCEHLRKRKECCFCNEPDNEYCPHRLIMVRSSGVYGYRPRCLQFLWRWERMFGDGSTVTAVLNYSHCKREARLKINVEREKEKEMRVDRGLQAAITEARDRAERRCRRDGVTDEVKVTVSYVEAETSTDTVEPEQRHLDRDSEAESGASDLNAETQSWHGLDQWQRDHPRAEPVESGPEANS
ncbi:hypothetical protein CBR_g3405 [Chara braunii]|uniref:Integrase catalytic domain-containing protein n=1 Tax=Chara braunii TaxID=69332 RepID=A0A388JR30_CHABU|nr:hypothetical protein CBR_g3405 [Chara braunii]|eukprot:GBG60162.1 hypothetical protein CBR_g3405 [Chara braunii]